MTRAESDEFYEIYIMLCSGTKCMTRKKKLMKSEKKKKRDFSFGGFDEINHFDDSTRSTHKMHKKYGGHFQAFGCSCVGGGLASTFDALLRDNQTERIRNKVVQIPNATIYTNA